MYGAMKLSDKGRFQARPRLPQHAEGLATELSTWPGVQPRAHWLLGDATVVDGADFYVGEEELGHLHLDGAAHIPQAKVVADNLVTLKLARPFRWLASWVEVDVVDAASRENALCLFRLNYDRLRGVHSKLLVERVQQASGALQPPARRSAAR